MCGIVGYVGSEKAKPILLEGLARLEYRGYDSAGMALVEKNGNVLLRRTVGRVQELVNASQGVGENEHQGIGHTRWATHGVPSEANAHPHRAGRVTLVHNGIIENHAEIRKELSAKGVSFDSQTDTEVFARLINDLCESVGAKHGKNFEALAPAAKREAVLEALQLAITRSRGHYAILFMVQGLDGHIFGVQNGAPLVYGLTPKGAYLASDIQALLAHTQNIGFIPQHTYFEGGPQGFSFFRIGNAEVRKVPLEKIEWSADRIAKEGYEHFMLKEIFEQPRVVADTLSGRLPDSPYKPFVWDHPEAHRALWKNAERIYLIGCGTAYYAAVVAKYFFEKWARIKVEVDFASEFRYRNPLLSPGTVVGVISQSGETADTLAALRLANDCGVSTFSICNVPGSSITRESGFQYPTKAGPEISVASTKAFMAQITVLCALARDVARLRGLFKGTGEDDFEDLSRLPHYLEQALIESKRFMDVGAQLGEKKTVIIIGRGTMYPLALEGALKMKEITYRHAEGYAAGELKHGPLALVNKDVVAIVLAPPSDILEKTVSNLEELRARGAKVIGICERGNEELKRVCDEVLEMPSVPEALTPMVYAVPLQLMAYGFAKALGHDIDKPRNLAKSVTVE